MAVAYVQQTVSPYISTTAVATSTEPVIAKTTVGNSVVVGFRTGGGHSLKSVTDTQGNTYTIVNSGGTQCTAAFAIGYQAVSLDPANSDSITITVSAATGQQWCADEYSGIPQTGAITNSVAKTASSANTISGTIAPVNATDEFFAVLADASSTAVAPSVDTTGNFSKRDFANPSTGGLAALYDFLNNSTTVGRAPSFTCTGSAGNMALVLVAVAAIPEITVSASASAGASETVTAPTLTAYDASVNALAPVAWWKLDEPSGSTTLKDSSGNGSTATVVNDATLGNTGPGLPGLPDTCAAGFGNYVSNVSFTASSELTTALQDHDFTFVSWAKNANVTEGNDYEWCQFGVGSQGYGTGLAVEHWNDRFAVNNGFPGSPAPTPVSIVQTTAQSEQVGASNQEGFASPTTTGNSLLVSVLLYSSDGGSNEIDMAATDPVSDGVNTFVPLTAGEVKQVATHWYQHQYWYLASSITGQSTAGGYGYNTITTNFQRSTYSFLTVWELTPCQFDQAITNTGDNGATDSTFTINVGTLTPRADGALAFMSVELDGYGSGSGSPTSNDLDWYAGWTEDRWDSAGGGEDMVVHQSQATAASIDFTAQGAYGGPQQWSASGIVLIPLAPVGVQWFNTAFPDYSIWRMFTWVYDSTTQMLECFVDGASQGTFGPVVIDVSGTSGQIGINPWTPSNTAWSGGSLSQISIFNYKLSSSQVSDLYTAAEGAAGASISPAAGGVSSAMSFTGATTLLSTASYGVTQSTSTTTAAALLAALASEVAQITGTVVTSSVPQLTISTRAIGQAVGLVSYPRPLSASADSAGSAVSTVVATVLALPSASAVSFSTSSSTAQAQLPLAATGVSAASSPTTSATRVTASTTGRSSATSTSTAPTDLSVSSEAVSQALGLSVAKIVVSATSQAVSLTGESVSVASTSYLAPLGASQSFGFAFVQIIASHLELDVDGGVIDVWFDTLEQPSAPSGGITEDDLSKLNVHWA